MTAAIPDRHRRSTRDRVMVTAEGVALPLTLASRGARAAALILDLIFIGTLMFATTFILGSVGIGAMSDAGTVPGSLGDLLQALFVVWIVAMFLFRNAYFLFFELGPRGATPGKRITGIRIAARDSGGGGARLSAEMVIARNLLRDIELFLPIVFIAQATGEGGDSSAAGLAATAWFLIFALFPLYNRDRLRAGDIIAGTWVVEAPKRKLEAAMTVTAPDTPSIAAPRYRFGEAELSVYGEYELQMLERVLRENRPEGMQAVYETICGKIGWSAGNGDARAFLEAYYAALRQRLEAGMRVGRRKADKHS
jgi:uncharacterized RDD family membrane protein YckC